jgi:hypothetical protein
MPVIFKFMFFYDIDITFLDTALFIFMVTYLVSVVFSSLSNKNRKLHYLMLPASATEKVIANWFIVYFFQALGATLCAIAGYYLTKLCTVPIRGGQYDFSGFELFASFVFMIIAVAGFGSVYFKSKALLKTVFTAGVVVIAYMTLYYYLIRHLYIDYLFDVLKSIPDGAFKDTLRYYFTFPVLADNQSLIYIGSAVIVSVFFWVLSYFRLKETEA